MAEITWWDKALQPTVIALACAAMIFDGGLAAIFRSTLLFFFIRISYSLYLIHLPLAPVSLRLSNKLSSGENVFFSVRSDICVAFLDSGSGIAFCR